METALLDFGQIIEKVTGFIGDKGGVQEVLGGNVAEALGNANIDPSFLENLPLDQVQTYLADAGIDPSALTDGTAGELLQKFSGSGGG